MKIGVMINNIGSPEYPTAKALKPYLDEFLMDPLVIDYPWILRALLVRGIILNTRPKKSAQAYQKIWGQEGSPLLVYSNSLAKKLQEKLGVQYSVKVAMRYGKPSLLKALEEWKVEGVQEILCMALYPQYAMSTVGSVIRALNSLNKDQHFSIKYLQSYYKLQDHIEALRYNFESRYSVEDFDHFLFSYHGVPQRHVKLTDESNKHCLKRSDCCENSCPENRFCYSHHCVQNTRLLAKALGVDQYTISFQSKLGPEKWLQPSTESQLRALGEKKIKRLAVFCPAFSADCIETLEEIEIEGQKTFKEAGGESFTMIPALNDSDRWVSVLQSWVQNDSTYFGTDQDFPLF